MLVPIFGSVSIHFIAIEHDLLPNKLSFSDSLYTEQRKTELTVLFSFLLLTHKKTCSSIFDHSHRLSSFHIRYAYSVIAHYVLAR